MELKIFKSKKKATIDWNSRAQKILASKEVVKEELASKEATYYGEEYTVEEAIFDGEVSQGELGAPVSYEPAFESLAYRSWQAYLESDIAKIIITAFVEWVVGPGLKLQAEPDAAVIESEGITFNKEVFVKQAESRFRLYMKSNASSFSTMENGHEIARKAYKSAIIGGDVLCIFRYDNGVNAELIDGRRIQSPSPYFDKRDWTAEANKRGNKIVYGVEINKRGTHVAYYITQENYTSKRVLARGPKTGRLQAQLIYGDEFRIGDVRGLGIMVSSLEKLKKLDRYIEAMVGGAEERAKVPWTIVNNHFSEGKNPFISAMATAYDAGEGTDAFDKVYGNAQVAAKKVAATTSKMPVNMPVGSELKALESTMETKMSEFVDGNFVYICASLGIPYEVALMKFVNSFSASRMASQSWQHILDTRRIMFSSKYYQPIYNIFLETQVLLGKINAQGYFTALQKDDVILTEAYRNARFTGKGVPQADPSKEVKAVVLMLQNNLITYEQASELLMGGDFMANLDRLGVETRAIMKILPKEFVVPPNPESDKAELGQQ